MSTKKQTESKNTNDRLIAKMVATALIYVGLAGFAGGTYACYEAVKNNPKTYNDNSSFIAGELMMSAGVPMFSIGLGCYPYANKKQEDNKEEQNTL